MTTWQETVEIPAPTRENHRIFREELCEMIKRQAEVSFKAGLESGKDLILYNGNMLKIVEQAKQEGRKEVVEWLQTLNNNLTYSFEQSEFDAKLKEWGG